jgi:hypothetical protein
MPYAGLLFDIAGNSESAYAVSIGEDALCKVENPANYARISNAMIRNLAFKHTIYEMYDEATGEVKYVGRTRQNIFIRQKQHWYTDPRKNNLAIRKATLEGTLLENLDYKEARGLEYKVFEKYERLYGGYNNAKFLNKIKPLNISKAKSAEYIEAAIKFLNKVF